MIRGPRILGLDPQAHTRAACSMYARRDPSGTYTLRQIRYRAQLLFGNEHSHDVCAIAGTAHELRGMCAKHWPDADYSAVLGAEDYPETIPAIFGD